MNICFVLVEAMDAHQISQSAVTSISISIHLSSTIVDRNTIPPDTRREMDEDEDEMG